MAEETLPDGWRPTWKPKKPGLTKAERKRLHREATTIVDGELIVPKGKARQAGVKMRPLDDALKAEIVERTSNGELLKSILAEPDMPSRLTVFRAQQNDEQFAADMQAARECAAAAMADELLEISDTAAEDYKPDGSINYEVIARSKLKTDTRRWLMERFDPKRFGSKGQMDITSGGEKIDAKDVSPLESARQVAFAIELAKRSQDTGE